MAEDLGNDYQRADFGGRLDFGARPALLVADAVMAYLEPTSPLYAEGFVRTTALDALQHGLAPFVVREACGERDAHPQEANLFDLQAKYAEVIDEAAALQHLVAARH